MDVVNAVAATGGKSGRHRITFFRGGQAQSLTLAELDGIAARLAHALAAAGFERGDRIGILARNGIEWVLLDLAAIKAGLVTAGFEFGKFQSAGALVSKYDLKGIYADVAVDDAPVRDLRPLVNDALARGAASEGGGAAAQYSACDFTTIKFTSGSTGEPKGLRASVGSINGSLNAVQTLFAHGAQDNVLVFLPLSLLQQRYWIYSALAFGHDVTVVSFPFALEAARRTQPTVIMGVPGFYDSVKKAIDRDAGVPADDLAARRAAIAMQLGGRLRYLWTGSAPARPDMLRFFEDAGVAIFEGYGMNETCIVSKNYLDHCRTGSVGRLLPGKRARIDADGVLIVGADHPVDTAYCYCAPGDNERMFLPNGDVRTGDIARIDADGYLYILGRADDIVVLANGKNVHARGLEERVKGHQAVEECVLFGAGKPYLVAIVSPTTHTGHDAIIAHIDAVNATLAPDERIVRAFIAPAPFSVADGLLTSQFKPKRKEIFKAFEREIGKMYGVNA